MIGHELAAPGLLQPLAHGRPLLIIHDVDVFAPSFDFARDLRKLLLVLLRP